MARNIPSTGASSYSRTPQSVVVRRLFGALARIGLDLRPWAERQRARLNRPVAEQLAIETSSLRAEAAEREAAAAAQGADLRAVLAEAVAMARAEAAAALAEAVAVRADAAAALAEAVAIAGAEAAAALAEAVAVRVDAAAALAEAVAIAGAEAAAALAEAVAVRAHASAALAEAVTAVRVDAAAGNAALADEAIALRQAHAEAHAHLTEAQSRIAHSDHRLNLLERHAAAASVLARHIAERALAVPGWPETDPSADTMPEVTVVMPVRDRERLVAHAIRSVKAQRGAAWELIVVDDGSTDGTVEAIAPFLADPRIRLLREPPRGQAAARNTAIAAARGGLIAYLDSDNAWFPGFLAAAVATFRADPDLKAAHGLLVADALLWDHSPFLSLPTDAATLAQGNTIDLNTYVHRRSLVAEAGGFDPAMTRVVDWDLVLRHHSIAPAARLPALAVAYRTGGQDRVSKTEPYGPNLFRVRRKRLPVPAGPAPRVLYAIWHYPQLTESYIETEIRCMRRFGADIRVWCEEDAASPYPPAVPWGKDALADAIAEFQPDLIHVHWLHHVMQYAPIAAVAGVPMTARAHGFDTTADSIAACLALPALEQLYLFPSMARLAPACDPRIRFVEAAFDTSLFAPAAVKDRRMVLRTAATLSSKALDVMLALAKRLPESHFVLVGGTCRNREGDPAALRALRDAMDSPVELRFDVQREEVAALMTRAGLYLHTALPPGTTGATPIGAPISIAEAMATGAHVLVPDIAPLVAYAGNAGQAYTSLDDAERLLRETLTWDEAAWRKATHASLDRAWDRHADETALHPVYLDWCRIASSRACSSPPQEAAQQ